MCYSTWYSTNSFAANACCNQKSLSPNQPVNFKYPKREYKDNNRAFQPHWYKRWKWLRYNDQKDSVTCYVSWHDHLDYMRPKQMMLLLSLVALEECNNTKKALINMKSQRFIVLKSIVLTRLTRLLGQWEKIC